MRQRHAACMAMLAAALLTAATAMGTTPYKTLAARAARAYDHSEWASASALMDLMLEQRPEVVGTYGRAITSRAMMDDTTAQMRLMESAIENHLPFDSVFTAVRTASFALGKSHIYEHFLGLVSQHYPWMKRTTDAYLLRYYTFRRNGPKMVEYAERMLAGAPGNVGFMEQLAAGHLQMGQYEQAVEAYKEILSANPSDVDALLWLGNYHAMQASASAEDAELARSYLSRAYDLRPTPYVAATLERLGTGATGK